MSAAASVTSTASHVRGHGPVCARFRRSRASSASTTPAGSSCSGSGRASSCGSRARRRTACSRRTRRGPGRRGSSSSRPGRPGSRARPGRRGEPSRVHTPAPSPYRVSLAILSASSSSSNVVTDTTGPKISSWKMRIALLPSKIVGCDVVAAGQVAAQVGPRAAGEHLRALLLADVEVGQDLLELVVGRLRADHRVGVERVALLDRLGALDRVAEELVVDRALDQRPGRAGADLALVEREHREALEGLVVEVVAARPRRLRRRCSGSCRPAPA